VDFDGQAREAAAAFGAGAQTDVAWQVLVADNRSLSQTLGASRRLERVGNTAAARPALDQLLCAAGGRPAGRILVAEVLVRATGEFEVSYTFDVDQLSPQVVFDPDYRYPGHPRVGAPTPPGPAPDTRPTDPTILAEVASLIAQYVERYTAIRGVAPDFGPGSSEEQIAAVERQLGFRLPDDVRAVYRAIHADVDHGLLGYFCPISLDEILEFRQLDWPYQTPRRNDLFDQMPIVMDGTPAGHVRRVSYSDRWVTFAQDYGGNWLAVDLDPGPLGRPGQLIADGRDVCDVVYYFAPSTVDLLRAVVASLRDEQWREPRPQEETVRLWPPEGFEFGIDGPSHEWFPDVGPAGLAAAVAEVADPRLIQDAHLRGLARAALAELAPLGNLRAVQFRDVRQLADEVGLAVPSEMPLELLRVRAQRFDLGGL
jgi:cell wall assembly regulator SMI1